MPQVAVRGDPRNVQERITKRTGELGVNQLVSRVMQEIVEVAQLYLQEGQ